MKSEKGVTLTALVIYILIATTLISTMAMFSSFFFSNMNIIKDQEKYSPEFNKFSMFFINDIKKNSFATIQDGNKQITLEDGTIYSYKSNEQAIYRGDTKIAQKVQMLEFTSSEVKVSNTTKQIIKVKISIGDKNEFTKEIEYVLKYW